MQRIPLALPPVTPWTDYWIGRQEADTIRAALNGMSAGDAAYMPTLQAWWAKCRAIDGLFDAALAADRRSA